MILFRYSEALVGLVGAVLNKMQFTYNQSQLEEIDYEVCDDEVIYILMLILICFYF